MTSKENHKKYNCDDIEKYAQQYLDDQLDENKKKLFNEHLEYCLPCDKKMEFEQKLKEIVHKKLSHKEAVDNLKRNLNKFITDSE
ncbi:MAG: zf-HC2 domain-containing protein [Calditrichaceae bacterium]|jgi:mycothiol system anti-sigma-R factor